MHVNIKETLTVCFTVLFALAPLQASDKTLNKTSQRNNKDKYFLVFCARPINLPTSPFGHAFVVWGLEDNSRKMSSQEAFGFYAVSAAKPVTGLDVPGELKAEAFATSLKFTTERLIVQVDSEVYDRAKVEARKWGTSDYNLASRNCVHFLSAIAKLAKLNAPTYNVGTLPQTYVKLLLESN